MFFLTKKWNIFHKLLSALITTFPGGNVMWVVYSVSFIKSLYFQNRVEFQSEKKLHVLLQGMVKQIHFDD